MMLNIRNLDAGYGGLTVLRRLSLHVKPGEIVTIIGANGAGKTTLLKTIMGLLRAQAGEIVFNGQAIGRVRTERIVFNGCSLVPEGRQVFPAMPVKENLLLGAYVQFKRGNKHEVERDLARVYSLFPVLKQREHQLAGTLSGGEQQMLAIARALMTNPRLLILDEATEGLAPLIRAEIYRSIENLKAEGLSILVIDKDVKALTRVADRHYVLEKGRVVWSGSSSELAADTNVQHRYLGV
jgi:branched-chain amino acid transport system ATP-binding protein